MGCLRTPCKCAVGQFRDDRLHCPNWTADAVEKDQAPSVPTSEGPVPKPAAKEMSQRAEGGDWRGAYTWLRGFIAGADPNWHTPVREELQILADAAARGAGEPLDPRLTYSADWLKFEELADLLAKISAVMDVLADDIDHLVKVDPEMLKTRFGEVNSQITTAIKAASNLGLPF